MPDHPADCECFPCRARSISFTGYRTVNGNQSFARDFEKKLDRDADAYRSARQEGIQPEGVSRRQVESAREFSDRHQVPYRGDKRTETFQRAGLVSEVREYTETEKAMLRGS